MLGLYTTYFTAGTIKELSQPSGTRHYSFKHEIYSHLFLSLLRIGLAMKNSSSLRRMAGNGRVGGGGGVGGVGGSLSVTPANALAAPAVPPAEANGNAAGAGAGAGAAAASGVGASTLDRGRKAVIRMLGEKTGRGRLN